MTLIQALIIAVIQGATELFPVSSLGHAVLLPVLLGMNIDQNAPTFLPFLVLLHLGTVGALLAYFWRDWWELASGLLGRDGPARRAESFYVLCLMVIATIPAVVLGGVLEHVGLGRKIFGTPAVAGTFLIVNAGLLLLGQAMRNRAAQHDEPRAIAALSYRQAAMIGLWQCLALIPGMSRSGATIVGGMRQGLSPAAAAHFSFLIAIPIIMGATVLEVPKLLHASVPREVFHSAAIAACVAGITALGAVALMMRFFRDHDSWALTPFAVYCALIGTAGLAAIAL